jgi:D-arabinitol 4-dehydrogenase
LVALACNPSTRIVSFTVTEAGYYLDAQDQLDWATFAELQADVDALRQGQAGRTLYGALCTLLDARRLAGAGPVTLLNCDNLRHNGDRSRKGLVQFLTALQRPELLAWVQENTSSPNAMVDRITPRPTAAVIERVQAATGVHDPAALMGERFIQWVIEDRFIHGRPDWARVGVELVSDVAPYEEAKIRLLNATHSCIAWAGTLLGLTYIHEGTQHPAIRQMAHDYVSHDAIPALSPSPIDLARYRDVVLDRFANPAIADTNQRVAMDAFSKIPGMIAPTLLERLTQGHSAYGVAILPALFLAYLQCWHAGGIAYTYQDQAMDPAVGHAIASATDPVAAFAADRTLWGEWANDARLVSALRTAFARVQTFVSEHQT